MGKITLPDLEDEFESELREPEEEAHISTGIGDRMMMARVKHDWTQAEFARRLRLFLPPGKYEFKQSSISDYETERRLMKPWVIVGVARALGVSVDWLMTGEGTSQHPIQHTETETAARLLDRLPEEERKAGLQAVIEIADEYERRRDENLKQYRKNLAAIEEVVGKDARLKIERKLKAMS
jgi:transcriptional regulator with XRE-family HTH domain